MPGFKTFAAGDVFNAADLNDRAYHHALVAQSILGNGVVDGCALTSSGFSLTIAAGTIVAGIGVTLAELTITVPDSVTRYVWLDSDGGYVLTPTAVSPGSGYCCVGSFTSDGSEITAVSATGKQAPLAVWSDDYTVTIAGGVAVNQSTGALAPASLGGNNAALVLEFADITGAKTDADYTLLAAEYSCPILRLAWTGWTGGHNVIVPTTRGAVWDVVNATGQAATVKTVSGTGIAVASGKAARVFCDGANVVRLTGDG